MKRRDFITLLGGAAVAWPIAARAQQPAMPVIGFVRSGTLADVPHFVSAFRQGLKEAGFVEGQNAAIELYSGDNSPGRLSALIVGLVRRPVAVIVGNNDAALAAIGDRECGVIELRPRLDLDKDQRVAAPRDDVDFADRSAIAPRHDAIALCH